MMSVASADNTTVALGGLGDVRPTVRRDSAENSLRRLVPHTWVLTARLLRRWRRDRATVLESLAMPVVLLVTLNIVLEEGISQVTGHSGLMSHPYANMCSWQFLAQFPSSKCG